MYLQNMYLRKINRPILTIFVIFGSAFILVAMGCGSGSSSKPQPKSAVTQSELPVGSEAPTADIVQELSPAEITRECSDAEFSKLVSWRNVLNSANDAVDQAKGQKNSTTIQVATVAVQSCDSVIEDHKSDPCRKTKKTIIGTDIKYYDHARLIKDCKKSIDYLVKYNARPAKGADAVVAPAPPSSVLPAQPPVVGTPSEPSQNGSGSVNSSEPLRQCSSDEFSKLAEYSSAQEKADAALKNLGSMSSWVYEANAISSSALAAKSCEVLIQYHSQNPCQKTVFQTDGSRPVKQYTGSSLRARCELARTYFYEFVQNTKTLIFQNADLYLDFSPLSPKIFEPGFKNQVSGNCLVENRTESTIDYSNRQALIVDTRGFEEKMLVLQTAEGLLIQCYGLNVDGPFSKRQIVKVLKDEQSDIRLSYKLK